MAKVTDHVRKVHKVETMTDTIGSFVKKSVRTV
jgi:predicted small metal-binding protein